MGTKGVTQAGIPLRDCSSRGRKEHWFHVSSASDEQSNYAALCYVKVAKKQNKKQTNPEAFLLASVNRCEPHGEESARNGTFDKTTRSICKRMAKLLRRHWSVWFLTFLHYNKKSFSKDSFTLCFFFFPQRIWFVFGETTGLNVQFAVMRSK